MKQRTGLIMVATISLLVGACTGSATTHHPALPDRQKAQ